jgi:hypothetical protein
MAGNQYWQSSEKPLILASLYKLTAKPAEQWRRKALTVLLFLRLKLTGVSFYKSLPVEYIKTSVMSIKF